MVVAEVIDRARTTDGGVDAAPLVGLLALAFITQHTVRLLQDAAGTSVSTALDASIRTRLAAASVHARDLTPYEDHKTRDELELAQKSAAGLYTPGRAAALVPGWLSERATGWGAILVLASVSWRAALVITVVWVLVHRWLIAEFHALAAARLSPERLARANYFKTLATDRSAAKEIRVYDCIRWIIPGYSREWTAAMREIWHARAANSWTALVTISLVAISVLAALLDIVFGGSGDVRDPGSLVLAAQALVLSAGIGVVSEAEIAITQGAASQAHALAAAVHLETDRRGGSAGDGRAQAQPMPSATAMEFENIWFTYPSGGTPALQGLTMSIPFGRRIAVVGPNGSGKTTLIKLLAGLYVPSEGELLIGGTKLTEIDIAEWRMRLGIIFQDYVRFEETLEANVAVRSRGQRAPGVERSMFLALAQSGADALAAQLPHGIDTVLSAKYADGTELSDGQWQRVVLARAFYLLAEGADILVLDEPTAHLDVRAEISLFDKILQSVHGRTMILVTHRLASVRRADTIFVLKDGRLEESGSHAELMASGGWYARMWRLQAQRFALE